MSEPSQRVIDAEYLVTRVGATVLICGALLYILWHDLGGLRKDMALSIRNERALMQKLGIPLRMDPEAGK